jgi:hypothetical protein
MSRDVVETLGTLQADGTLVLDEKTDLPAGRVRVRVERLAEPAPPKEDWWQCLQRIRAEREQSGYPFMTEAEMKAFIEDLRSGDERLEEVYRQVEEARRTEPKGC